MFLPLHDMGVVSGTYPRPLERWMCLARDTKYCVVPFLKMPRVWCSDVTPGELWLALYHFSSPIALSLSRIIPSFAISTSVCLSDGEAVKHSCLQPQPHEQHVFRTTDWINEFIYEMGQCQMCPAKFKCHDKRRLVGTNLSRNKGWSGRELSCLGIEVTKVILCQITREIRNINYLIMHDCLLKVWNNCFWCFCLFVFSQKAENGYC